MECVCKLNEDFRFAWNVSNTDVLIQFKNAVQDVLQSGPFFNRNSKFFEDEDLVYDSLRTIFFKANFERKEREDSASE